MSLASSPTYAEIDRLQGFLDQRKAQDAPGASAWTHPLREQGLNRARQLGFPNVRQEEWRYTSLEPLTRLPFSAPTTTSLPGVAEISRFFMGGPQARRLVFVNGSFAPSLSHAGALDGGLEIDSLTRMLAGNSGWAQTRLDRCAGGYNNPMGALNTAFFQDGAVIRIPANTAIAEPIQLLFLTHQTTAGTAHHTRNLVVAEKQAQACIIETHASLADGQYVTNCLTELFLEPGAQLEHCRLQLESLEAFHFGATHAWQERDSTLLSHSLSLGARLARQDIRSVLNGEDGYALFNGLYLVQDNQLSDHHTVMDHARPHCESHEYYHGILEGRAKGVFNGKIYVRPDAQKTDAKQTNRNLLLSSDATIDAKPQLEIFADDVKCTHGATVGQLDEDALFYLRSRGIGVEEARRILIHAFAAVIVQRLKMESIRPELDQWVLDKLQGGKGENDR